MISNWIRKIARNKEFTEGARLEIERFNYLPFKNSFNNVIAMFEVRKWYVLNTPYKYYGEKYTGEMAKLHGELNYLQSKQFLKRVAITSLFVFIFSLTFNRGNRDWKDNFDPKFENKTYGSIAGSSGEGLSGLDDE
jgi:hypothetical protein